jgi:hypothetical protein
MSDKEFERDSIGRFLAASHEPIVHRVSFKLPESVKNELKKVAGDHMSAWLREAVIEKLDREKA